VSERNGVRGGLCGAACRMRTGYIRSIAKQNRPAEDHFFNPEILDCLNERLGRRLNEDLQRVGASNRPAAERSSAISVSFVVPGGNDVLRCVPFLSSINALRLSPDIGRYQTQFQRRLPTSVAPSSPGTR
jgi:hypothetical protein